MVSPGRVVSPGETLWLRMMMSLGVATPLWAKCEGEAHTPKVGDLESSGTPECLEFDRKAQNTSH